MITTTSIFGGPIVCFRKEFIIFDSVTGQIAESPHLRPGIVILMELHGSLRNDEER
jgi:hypothetical protein